MFCVFFFSSRRRHTRLQGDWSSDVCSSDLGQRDGTARRPEARSVHRGISFIEVLLHGPHTITPLVPTEEIGRASCRERGEGTVGAGRVEKETETRGRMRIRQTGTGQAWPRE